MEIQLKRKVSLFSSQNRSEINENHSVQALSDMANVLRIDSVEMTSLAGSGHPTSCASMADIISVLFFDPSGIHYEPTDPKLFASDRLILSKGHAAPILYAAWSHAGYLDKSELKTLRQADSMLSGHPTTALPFVDIASGSLGQGLSAAMGMAYASKYVDKIDNKYFVIMGDAEIAEGQVWEACSFGAFYKLNNVISFVDVNRMGQTGINMFDHNVENYQKKFEAFGCHAITVNGHDIVEIILALRWAREVKDAPVVIIAKTFKGKNLTPAIEDKDWHGRPLGSYHEASIRHLGSLITDFDVKLEPKRPEFEAKAPEPKAFKLGALDYTIGKEVATRQAYGNGLKRLANQDEDDLIFALDGDTQTSTMVSILSKAHPKKFIECFVAEQNMLCVAQGLSTRGRIPFCSTFGAFMSRAFDQARVIGISQSNVKFCGSHAGVSIGPDGATQMGLEDLAMFRSIPKCIVLYPSDAVSTERAVELAANHFGPVYIRTSRPINPVIYSNEEEFEIGKAKIVKQTKQDVLTIVTSGVTLTEALKASDKLALEGINVRVVDLFSVKPVDIDTLEKCGKETCYRLLTIEDHYAEGGIHEAVSSALSRSKFEIFKICVDSVPKSGTSLELLDRYNLSASKIEAYIKSIL